MWILDQKGNPSFGLQLFCVLSITCSVFSTLAGSLGLSFDGFMGGSDMNIEIIIFCTLYVPYQLLLSGER